MNRRQVQFVVTVEKGHFCALQWKMWTKENVRFAFSCNINFNFSAKCPGICLLRPISQLQAETYFSITVLRITFRRKGDFQRNTGLCSYFANLPT